MVYDWLSLQISLQSNSLYCMLLVAQFHESHPKAPKTWVEDEEGPWMVCLLLAWQQQISATMTTAALGGMTVLCFPLLVIGTTTVRTRQNYVFPVSPFEVSSCMRLCCWRVSGVTKDKEWDGQGNRNWIAVAEGGSEWQSSTKMVCKCCAHPQFISAGDGCI